MFATQLVWPANRLNDFFKAQPVIMNYPLRRTCKEIASRVVEMQDRDLSLKETAELRLHMALCRACPGFENQFLTMKSAMKQWRNYADESPGVPNASAEPANSRK